MCPRAKIESEGAKKARAKRRHFAPQRDAACVPLPLMRLRLCRLHLHENRSEKKVSEKNATSLRNTAQETTHQAHMKTHQKKKHDSMKNRHHITTGAGETGRKAETSFAIGRDGTSNMAWGIGSRRGRRL